MLYSSKKYHHLLMSKIYFKYKIELKFIISFYPLNDARYFQHRQLGICLLKIFSFQRTFPVNLSSSSPTFLSWKSTFFFPTNYFAFLRMCLFVIVLDQTLIIIVCFMIFMAGLGLKPPNFDEAPSYFRLRHSFYYVQAHLNAFFPDFFSCLPSD